MAHPKEQMRWKNDLKINIPTIDAQHKQLFNIFTDLNKALQEGIKASVIEDILTRLQHYVSRHFTMEENYMKESNYPRIEVQIEAHQYFSQRFSEILAEFKQKGLTSSIVKTIQTELGEWLETHVLELDMDFGRFYISQQKLK